MEKEEKEYVEHQQSKLEQFADSLVEALEINAWTYGNSGEFID